MVHISKVVAELRFRGVEPQDYYLEQRTSDLLWLTLNSKEYPPMSGAAVVRTCAEAAGDHQITAECDGRTRGFSYKAPKLLVSVVNSQLRGTPSCQTYSAGAGGAAPQVAHTPARGPRGPAAAAAAAAAAGGVALEPATPPAAFGGGISAAAVAGSGNVRGGGARQRAAATAGRAAVVPLDFGGLQVDPELMYLLQTQHGGCLVNLMGVELEAWELAKRTLAAARQQQEASLAVQHDSLQQMLHQGAAPAAQAHVSALMTALEAEAASQLAALTAAEGHAADRVRLVQQAIDADPTARLLLFAGVSRRPAVLRYAVVALGAMLLGVLLHAVSPQCLEGVRALMARLTRQCVKCIAGVLLAGWRLGRAVVVVLATLVLGLLSGSAKLLLGCCSLWRRGCRFTARLLQRWVLRACMCSASCDQQGWQSTTHPNLPSQPLQPAVCLPAAANAAAIYTATAAMHSTVTALRSYYHHQQQQQQQQPPAGSAAASGADQSQVQPSAPSVCDLCALVVGVSRLVQMEYGALHGQGECHLRDQVLRLLCGLLAVEAGGVIRSEAPMGGGRSDLLISDRYGVSLLVVEYKQRHSGAMSAHQHQDAVQLKKYLSDRRQGCAEGLLITFDKTLPNGLSATRLTRVTDREASTQLYRNRNAPGFMSQPLHRLESDPLAVGVMMGLCQGFGVEVVQP